MPEFVGLTAEHCRKAWIITCSAFKTAFENQIVSKWDGTVVVFCPAGRTTTEHECIGRDLVIAALDQYATEDFAALNHPDVTNRILFAGCVGEQPNARYTWYALNKALVAERTGMASGDVRMIAPWQMLPGDIKFRGGFVDNGLVIGFSGVQESYDEAIARTMAAWIQGQLREEMDALSAVHDPAFVPAREAASNDN